MLIELDGRIMNSVSLRRSTFPLYLNNITDILLLHTPPIMQKTSGGIDYSG